MAKNTIHLVVLLGALISSGLPIARAKGGSDGFQFGSYMASTESEWTVGFELLPDGKAKVTTSYDEDYDAKGNVAEHKKTTAGTWTYQKPYLTLSYDGLVDRFAYAEECINEQPCFKYVKSLKAKAKDSPLDVGFAFLNPDWRKNWNPEARLKKCATECEKMQREGSLKKGMDLKTCASSLCK